MPDAQVDSAPTDHLRIGLRLSVVSILWTLTTSTLAIAIGFATGGLVLVAFGFVSVLDAVGSGSLVVHFRHAMRHESISARHERAALSVVTFGLITVGVATLVESARRILDHVHASPAPVGVGLATLAVLVQPVLGWRKRQVGLAIPSRALIADGWLSATGALLALVTVAGTGLAAAYGWWWIDPGGAAVIGAAATGVGASLRRGIATP